MELKSFLDESFKILRMYHSCMRVVDVTKIDSATAAQSVGMMKDYTDKWAIEALTALYDRMMNEGCQLTLEDIMRREG